MTPFDSFRSLVNPARIVAAAALALAVTLPGGAQEAKEGTYTWSAELVAVDEQAGTITAQARLVTEADAEARVDATLDFLDAHGHLVISSGPYLLERYDPAAQYAELTAFRDPAYPFTAETWRRGDPPTIAIAPSHQLT